jgi:hypothetical protein
MGTITFEKKVARLPDDLKLKVEGYIDALLSEKGISLNDLTDIPNESSKEPFVIKPGFGGGKGIFSYMAEDFDAPLKEFHDYMYTMDIEFIEKIEKLPVPLQKKLESITDEMLADIKSAS